MMQKKKHKRANWLLSEGVWGQFHYCGKWEIKGKKKNIYPPLQIWLGTKITVERGPPCVKLFHPVIEE